MTNARILSYGVLGLPLAFAAVPIYIHVPRLYAEVAGTPLALLGLILLAARLLDAGIDPWLGWLADRVARRQMLAVALLPFGLGFMALLNPPTAHAGYWLLASLALTYVGFSAATVAYQAWGANAGKSSTARTRLTAAREGFGLLGVVLAAGLPTLLAANLNAGLARMSWLLPALLLLAALISFVGAPRERRAEPSDAPLLPSLSRVARDKPFRRLLWIFVANGTAAALPATLFLFFVADVLHLESASGPLLASYFIAGAVSLPLWLRLTRQCGRVTAWLIAMAVSIAAFAWAGLLGSGDLWPFALICVASGAALGADLALPAAIAADLGERAAQTGSYFGVWNFVAKLNLALAAGVALPLLGALGYAPGQASSHAALTFAYALLPLAFKALAAVLLWRWRHSLET